MKNNLYNSHRIGTRELKIFFLFFFFNTSTSILSSQFYISYILVRQNDRINIDLKLFTKNNVRIKIELK